MKTFGLFLGAFIFVASSCVLFPLQYIEIAAWTPSSSSVQPSTLTSVSVTFSKAVVKTKAEKAFSLTQNGQALSGTFDWNDDRTLVFTPFQSLPDEARYVLGVDSTVEDSSGLSMKGDFQFVFGQTSPPLRPTVTSVTPTSESATTAVRPTIQLVFSKAMNPTSVQDGFAISPSATGYFSWSVDQKTFTYNLLTDLTLQQYYTLSLTAQTADTQASALGSAYSSRFFVGVLNPSPIVLSAAVPGGTLTEGISVVNSSQSIEKNDSITVTSNLDLPENTVSGQITINPTVSFSLSWTTAKRVFVVKPDSNLTYGQPYTLTIKKSLASSTGIKPTADLVYNFVVNGPKSAPLSINRIGFVEKPTSLSDRYVFLNDVTPASPSSTDRSRYQTLYVGNYPSSSSVANAVVDVYFKKPATGVALSALSLMQNFSVQTVSGDAALIQAVEIDPSTTFAGFATAASGTESVARFYITWTQVSTTSGLMTFQVNQAVSDSFGNTLAGDFTFPIYKGQ